LSNRRKQTKPQILKNAQFKKICLPKSGQSLFLESTVSKNFFTFYRENMAAKKNIKASLTAIALFGTLHADQLLHFESLGTGQEIRTAVIADQESDEEMKKHKEGKCSPSSEKKESEEKEKSDENGEKSKEGKCSPDSSNQIKQK
jgi:hypothetical protein